MGAELFDITKSEEVSTDQQYVYHQEIAFPTVNFILLHPGIPNGPENDRTRQRLIDFAKVWGCGKVYLTNIFDKRAKDFEHLKQFDVPFSGKCLANIVHYAKKADIVIAGWGNEGDYLDREAQVLRALRLAEIKIWALGINQTNTPRHPLFCPSDVKLVPFNKKVLTVKNK